MDARKLAKELEAYAIGLRRELHMHPEMPLEEKWTSERIRTELDALGIEYEVVGKYNVIAKLVCGDGTGKKLAIRADIDALPIQEATDVPFKSVNDGFMHACGPWQLDFPTTCITGLRQQSLKLSYASILSKA